MDSLGPAEFYCYTEVVLRVRLYCHDPVGTTELVLYRAVKCIVCFIQSVLKRGSILEMILYCPAVSSPMMDCYSVNVLLLRILPLPVQ